MCLEKLFSHASTSIFPFLRKTQRSISAKSDQGTCLHFDLGKDTFVRRYKDPFKAFFGDTPLKPEEYTPFWQFLNAKTAHIDTRLMHNTFKHASMAEKTWWPRYEVILKSFFDSGTLREVYTHGTDMIFRQISAKRYVHHVDLTDVVGLNEGETISKMKTLVEKFGRWWWGREVTVVIGGCGQESNFTAAQGQLEGVAQRAWCSLTVKSEAETPCPFCHRVLLS